MTYASVSDLLAVDLPVGEYGSARVARFEVSEEDSRLTSLRAVFQGGRGSVPAGMYTQLIVDGRLWMSDTPDERRDHLEVLYEVQSSGAKTALVAGLGLGMVVGALLQMKTIRSVTVVEINSDVIALVGPYYQELAASLDKELVIVCGDARNPSELFPSGVHWDVVWSDIWDTICADDYEEHKLMRRSYGRRSRWQGVWCGDAVRRAALEERNRPSWRW